MRIILAGGSGFLGEAIKEYFENIGNEIFVLTRNPKRVNEIYWDAKSLGDWSTIIENADVLINFVGKSVDCRYTESNRLEILHSRILSTEVLQQAVSGCKRPPKIWINASSATIYVNSESKEMTEANGIIGDDFSMNICKKWEGGFFKISNPNVRKVAIRTSIVLGVNGGAFPKLKLISKLGLGGKQGRGNQMVSWIHILDFCRAIDFIISNDTIDGPINLTAPKPIQNKHFMKICRSALKINFGLPSSKFILEIASFFLRTETELLLKSRNVIPEILTKAGFKFLFPDSKSCIENLISNNQQSTQNASPTVA
jgi:uncharacterized protein (TIGR01777 family)